MATGHPGHSDGNVPPAIRRKATDRTDLAPQRADQDCHTTAATARRADLSRFQDPIGATHSVLDGGRGHGDNSYGAHFAEVGVDADTGEIRLRRMLGVFAAGRVLNEKTARPQAIAG
jgi:xanthine dehydrogenase YagR molybdenum-binding subunit